METAKFEPTVNWLPAGYASTTQFHAINPAEILDDEDIDELIKDKVYI